MTIDEIIAEMIGEDGQKANDMLANFVRPFCVAAFNEGNRQGFIRGANSVRELIEQDSQPELHSSIERLNLKPRVRNCLVRHFGQIGHMFGPATPVTIAMVLESTDEELLQLINFGRGSLEELDTKLARLGFTRNEHRA